MIDIRQTEVFAEEMRIDHGPGYRVYFVRHGGTVVILLCGGDKQSQSRDVARALELAHEVRGERGP
ncbi:MAG TPA: type II toxin-antitoxin system RelE/ParE family toxin [Devosiaceae bacterium]|nr:type II toxin-antitoxin system RelE/ParE family toxin [Devosiaceae bacterium]